MFSLFFGSKLTTRQIIKQIIFAMYAISSSYFTWKAICCILDNDSPIVCVLTQSMEPGYRRGDILLLGSRSRDGIRPFAVGDTAVWSVKEGTIPIVHRGVCHCFRRISGSGICQNRFGKRSCKQGCNHY